MGQGIAPLTPAARDYAFGGRRLERYGKRVQERTAETWEFSLYPERPSRLADGEALPDHLSRAWGWDARARADLPLVKLLDIQGDLPVHCHPSDAQAHSLPGDDPGKDEAWLVLEAGPEAAVYLGFSHPMGEEDVVAAIRGEGLRPHMVRLVPRPGDVIMVPTGTAHAARDIVIYEVQQTSDRSFLAEKVDLWGRTLDPETVERQGREFARHVRRAPPHAALHAAGVLQAASAEEPLPLVGCDHFGAEVWTLTAPRILPPGAYTVLAGGVAGQDAGVGQTLLVGPDPTPLSPQGGFARLVRAWAPDPGLAQRLRAAGRYLEGMGEG